MTPQKNIGLHYDATVLCVVDGDTVIVSYGYRQYNVRLYAIDAPELGQKYGSKSADILRNMVQDKVSVEVIGMDKYKRIIGLVYPYQGNPRNSYNLSMVRGGHAFWSKIYGGEEYGFQYAEKYAKNNKLGVWSEPQLYGTRPWDYRKEIINQPNKQNIVRRLFKYIIKIIITLCSRQIL